MSSQGRILVDFRDSIVRESDLASLEHGEWLNDVIISFWMQYLEAIHEREEIEYKIVFIPCSLSQLIKSHSLTKNILPISTLQDILSDYDIENADLIFLPISDCNIDVTSTGGTHWSLLMYDASGRFFIHYDSLNLNPNREEAFKVVQVLSQAYPVLRPQFFDGTCHKQEDSSSCGLYVLAFMEALCFKKISNDCRSLTEIMMPGVIEEVRHKIKESIIKLMEQYQPVESP